jgi:glycine hydroxymethyltransferase
MKTSTKKLNSAVFPGGQGGPLCHVIAAKAVAFKEALQPEFKDYQVQVVKNAQAMVEVFLARGYDVVSGKTDNHLFLLDLISKDITGKDADAALGNAFITVNKNSVPNDPRSPFVTSGLRIGSPAITRRGFNESDAQELTGWICDVLDNIEDIKVQEQVREKVKAICAKHPVYA